MNEQTSVSSCCVTGHIHEGTPQGSFSVLHGLRTYIANPHAPTSPTEKQNVVIVLPDIFGVDLVNTKLLVDEWAGRGWKVLLPDVFEGDAISDEYLKTIVPNPRDKAKATILSKAADTATMGAVLGPWIVKHREAVARPIIEAFVNAVKAEPSTGKIASIGFCWGGRYTLLLCQASSPAKIDVGVAYHPSFLVNADVEPINDVPVAVFKGTDDDMMADSALTEVVDILKKNLGAEKVLEKRYEGAVHGFAVRGDDMVEQEKKNKEDAAKLGMDFVAKVFGA